MAYQTVGREGATFSPRGAAGQPRRVPHPPTSKTVTRVLSLQLKLAPEPLRVLFVSLAPRFLHGGREVILSAAIFGELLIRKETLLAAS